MERDELSIAISKFDIDAWAHAQGGDNSGRDEFVIVCAVCHKDKLSINLRTRTWRCFVCEKYKVGPDGKSHAEYGAGGLFKLIQWQEKLTAAQTARKIIDATQPKWLSMTEIPELPRIVEDTGERLPSGLPDGCIKVTFELPYMKKRGITIDDANAFGLGYCTEGWVANRLVFPVWRRGQCIYWQARAMWEKDEHIPRFEGDKFRKTVNPSVFYCSRCKERFHDGYIRCGLCGAAQQYGAADVLGNVEQAAMYPRVAICEGPTSAIRVGPSAVWTFGKLLHPQQICALVENKVRAVDIIYDGPSEKEPQGTVLQMHHAAVQLSPFIPDIRIVYLPKDDPATYSREHLAWFRCHAKPFQNQTF